MEITSENFCKLLRLYNIPLLKPFYYYFKIFPKISRFFFMEQSFLFSFFISKYCYFMSLLKILTCSSRTSQSTLFFLSFFLVVFFYSFLSLIVCYFSLLLFILVAEIFTSPSRISQTTFFKFY